MLNNAIEHSKSLSIYVTLKTNSNNISFTVVDTGIGIFNNIKHKFHLKDTYEAIEEILKGKKTTMPKKHSGEGIFFTSKIADKFYIENERIRLIIDNLNNDVFLEDIRHRKGTLVFFQINRLTRKTLQKLFAQYTDDNYKFSKTKVMVKLYEENVEYVSRSQARRLISGLSNFNHIVLDFKDIKGVGQGFTDEIFRVFHENHPAIIIETINCSNSVQLMVNRSKSISLPR